LHATIRIPHPLTVFVVTEAQAAMIRATYEQRGEFSAAVDASMSTFTTPRIYTCLTDATLQNSRTTNFSAVRRSIGSWAANASTKADRDGHNRVAAGLDRMIDRREQQAAKA
jgi:hypothetical protein